MPVVVATTTSTNPDLAPVGQVGRMSSVANELGRTAPSELRRTWQRSSRHPSIWKPGDQQFRELRTWTGVPGCNARAGVGDRRDKVTSIGVSLGRR
jgi:hypothetical protein